MIWRAGVIIVAMLTINGCELIKKRGINGPGEGNHSSTEEIPDADSFCIASLTEAPVFQNCNMAYWLNYWSAIENQSWPQRKIKIEQLGQDPSDTLKKILLSQGKATPYKDRLRAQSWVESLLPKLSPQMRNFIAVAVYQPSQELLEMESALVTLSRMNTDLGIQNEEQKAMIEKQKNQIEQLLKIEASIMDNENGDKL